MSALPATDALPADALPADGRLPKLEGIDYKRAALEYPRLLDAERSYYLRTKPFYNLANKPAKHTGDGMDPETHRHFTDFANMAVALALTRGREDSRRRLRLRLAERIFRAARLRRHRHRHQRRSHSHGARTRRERSLQRGPRDRDRCRFLTHDIETAPLPIEFGAKFDAMICYDSLHHLVDERAVFRHLAAMLDVGGLLFILEGHKPAAGSATEDELREVMRRVWHARIAF